MLNSIRNVKFIKMQKLTIFITAVCVLFLSNYVGRRTKVSTITTIVISIIIIIKSIVDIIILIVVVVALIIIVIVMTLTIVVIIILATIRSS